MSDTPLALVLPPEALDAARARDGVVLVDVGSPESYVKQHLPGAVFLEYAWIVDRDPPRMGLLPPPEQLARVLGALGITPETHVIAYDDEGGGRAARLLWTLDVIGHRRFSLLDGGLQAWAGEGRPLETAIHVPRPAHYPVPAVSGQGMATREEILARLGDPGQVLLDARSEAEYTGRKVLAQRGGHIPGAVHYEWTRAMDRQRHLRLRPAEALRDELAALGVTPDREVVTYCQTHHRSALSYIVLKWLGFPRVKGYAGSWSDWGNAADTPVETGA